MTARTACVGLAITVGLIAMSLAHSGVEAHKPITSKYTYYGDVKTLLAKHCGSCHSPGGVAPMSLLDYQSATPWAEAIRQELLAGHMPPWKGDPAFAGLLGPTGLSPREFDILMTWVSGGTPEGAVAPSAPASPPEPWPLGVPDAVVTLPSSGLRADQTDDVVTAEVPIPGAGVQWLRAVDLRPGTTALVRAAAVGILPPGSSTGPGLPPVTFVWLPGGTGSVLLPADAGLRVAPRSRVFVRLWYRKTWQYEGRALEDASQIGFYWHSAAPPRTLRQLQLSPPSGAEGQWRARLSAPADMTVVAVTALPAVSTTISLRVGDPARLSEVLVTEPAEPRWPRRWVFSAPHSVRAGQTIELSGRDQVSSRDTLPAPALLAADGRARLFLDIVEARPSSAQ